MAEQYTYKGKCTGRERLIQAAKILTEERPFDDITIEDIIKTAELSRPAFYYHFAGGKEELRAELINQGLLDQAPTRDARLAILLIYTHPHAAHVLADKIVRGRKRIIEYIQKRQEDGYFCKNIDANLFLQVIAMLFAMRAIGRGLNDLLPFANLSREETIDQLVTLLLYGMVQRDRSPRDETRVS